MGVVRLHVDDVDACAPVGYRAGDERLTGALLDRLPHHVSILEMNGVSYRLARSKTRKAR